MPCMTPTLIEQALRWIEASWREEGSKFGADNIPVAQFDAMDVDDMSYPLRNQGSATWLLQRGALIPTVNVAIARVPYVAFALLEDKNADARPRSVGTTMWIRFRSQLGPRR